MEFSRLRFEPYGMPMCLHSSGNESSQEEGWFYSGDKAMYFVSSGVSTAPSSRLSNRVLCCRHNSRVNRNKQIGVS
jgi:hypothetical protein